MKELRILGLVIAMSFIVGCTGGEDGASDKINVLGTWNYTVKNSKCGDMVAQGVEIVESNDGNTDQVGAILIQGTALFINNGICAVGPLDGLYNNFVGNPSSVSEPDYMNNYVTLTLGPNVGYITNSDIKSYTSSQISMTLTTDQGSTINLDLTKQ